jgi:formiminoglutamate deiminase
MTPDDVEAVATRLYAELLEAGFTRIGEFHYLHHDTDGRPYADPAEMAGRIAAAASATGIGLTLLPVLYAQSNFGGAAPTPGQRRFLSGPDLFARLVEGARAAVSRLEGAMVGIAPHSLRAVTPEALAAALPLAGDGPVHIHVAEQIREVEDCLAWSGARPVQWLLANAPVDRRWCLVHATHMTDAEGRALAASGATAGLCPITEANLGDGIFDAQGFAAAGGRFGIGSDSHVEIGLGAELRLLEYGQRLARRARNVLAGPNGSTGRALFDAARVGGAAALAAPAQGLAVGAPADIVTLRPGEAHAGLAHGDRSLDLLVFAPGAVAIDTVLVAGRVQVVGGRHVAREPIERRYAETLRRLTA